MRIRSTECEHEFTKKLFSKLGAYSLQGLTMSSDHRWTAAIEAIQYDDDEIVDLYSIFELNDLRAKYSLAKAIEVPLYFLIYQKGNYSVFFVSKTDHEFLFSREKEFGEDGFIDWWKSIKGTDQSKDFNNGATPRATTTIFDRVLEKHHLSWGGNIDGFIFRRQKPVCIIENIYTYQNPLDSPYGEPSKYFLNEVLIITRGILLSNWLMIYLFPYYCLRLMGI